MGYCKVGSVHRAELHYVYSQISEEWLDKALEHLDAKVTALYAKFNEFLNEFVVDGTGIPCDSLVERERVMKKRLAKETEDIQYLRKPIRWGIETTFRVQDDAGQNR